MGAATAQAKRRPLDERERDAVAARALDELAPPAPAAPATPPQARPAAAAPSEAVDPLGVADDAEDLARFTLTLSALGLAIFWKGAAQRALARTDRRAAGYRRLGPRLDRWMGLGLTVCGTVGAFVEPLIRDVAEEVASDKPADDERASSAVVETRATPPAEPQRPQPEPAPEPFDWAAAERAPNAR